MDPAALLLILFVPLGVLSGETVPDGEPPSERTKKDVSRIKGAATSFVGDTVRKSLSAVESYLPPTSSYQTGFGGGCPCYTGQGSWRSTLSAGVYEPATQPDFNYRRPVVPSPPLTGPSGWDYQRAPPISAPPLSPQYNTAWQVPNSIGITAPGYYYDAPAKRFDT